MKRRIAVLIPWSHLVFVECERRPESLSVWDFFYYGSCKILGVEASLSRMAAVVYILHSEFDPVAEGCEAPAYYYDEAKRRFPYLFSDTNSLLYRKF